MIHSQLLIWCSSFSAVKFQTYFSILYFVYLYTLYKLWINAISPLVFKNEKNIYITDTPAAPSLKVVSTLSHSFIVKLDFSQLISWTQLPLLKCSVFYKQLYGGLSKFDLPAGRLLTREIQVSNLQCGRPYQIYARCSNVAGLGSTSEQISAKTQGSKPKVPSASFLNPRNTSVRLDLAQWNEDTCPVSYFVVEYKKRDVSIYSTKPCLCYLLLLTHQAPAV